MRIHVKSVPIWIVALLLAASVVSTAAALTIRTLQIERINIWSGQIQDTDFTITGIETKMKGKHQIEISLTIKNNDESNKHTAKIAVQLLDSDGEVVVDGTANLKIEAKGTVTQEFKFQKENLVSQYSQLMVVITQEE
ncbi:MAG: SLAP domain-containing protein [Candidatus Helarchaeota archaeon]